LVRRNKPRKQFFHFLRTAGIAHFLLQSSWVMLSGLSTNKVAIGRVLPVLLAILFVGGSEQAPFAPAWSLAKGQPCRAGALQPKHAFYGNARTALALLPALLHQTYVAGNSSAASFVARFGQRQAAALLSTAAAIDASHITFSSLSPDAVWQRPPPSV
jgi:hypothetical protein